VNGAADLIAALEHLLDLLKEAPRHPIESIGIGIGALLLLYLICMKK
jgi:hypothetical protein